MAADGETTAPNAAERMEKNRPMRNVLCAAIQARTLLAATAFAFGTRFGCEPWLFTGDLSIAAAATVAAALLALRAWQRRGPAGRIACLCAFAFAAGATHGAAGARRGIWFRLAPELTSNATASGVFEVRTIERAPDSVRLHGTFSEAVIDGRRIEGRDTLRIVLPANMPLGPTPIGSQWRAEGRLSLPRDWRARGARLHARRAAFRMMRTGAAPLFDVADFRARAERLLDPGLPNSSDSVALLKAIVLGVSGDRIEVFDLFSRSGTLHVFAVSGLHVGIICAIVIFLLRAEGLPRNRWAYVLIPLLAGYAAVTGWRASAVRACIMAGVYFTACAMNRAPNARSALGVAVAAIVAEDYRRVFDVGFIFSAVIVWILIDWYSIVLRRLSGRRSAIDAAFRGSAWKLGQRGRELLAISVTAWIGSVPLTAYFFGRISLIGIPANLVAVPLSFVIVVAGCLALLGGAALPALGALYGSAAVAMLDALTAMCRQLVRLPYASIEVDPPAAGLVLAWYILLACARTVLIFYSPNCNDETDTAPGREGWQG